MVLSPWRSTERFHAHLSGWFLSSPFVEHCLKSKNQRSNTRGSTWTVDSVESHPSKRVTYSQAKCDLTWGWTRQWRVTRPSSALQSLRHERSNLPRPLGLWAFVRCNCVTQRGHRCAAVPWQRRGPLEHKKKVVSVFTKIEYKTMAINDNDNNVETCLPVLIEYFPLVSFKITLISVLFP